METVSSQLVQSSEDLIRRMISHPFLRETADGTVSDETFQRWLVQDYLWVLEYQRALGAVCSRAPSELHRHFHEAMLNLHGEIEVFEEIAARESVRLGDGEMILAGHAYSNYLKATAAFRTFGEGLSVVYAGNLSYLRAWSSVKEQQRGPSRWQEFIDSYSGEGYRHWVKTLSDLVDRVSEFAPAALTDRMKVAFRTTVRYEIYFWDAIYRNQDW